VHLHPNHSDRGDFSDQRVEPSLGFEIWLRITHQCEDGIPSAPGKAEVVERHEPPHNATQFTGVGEEAPDRRSEPELVAAPKNDVEPGHLLIEKVRESGEGRKGALAR